MLGQCHDNQETKTCFDIVETISTSRQKLSSYVLEHEKNIFSLVDPLNRSLNPNSNPNPNPNPNQLRSICHVLTLMN